MKTNNYLTTNEFIKRVEALGFTVDVDDEEIIVNIVGYYEYIVAVIKRRERYIFDLEYTGWRNLSGYEEVALFALIVAYASTPVDKREEEKKYYLKHRWLRCLGGCALLHESTKFHTFVLMGGFGEVPKDCKMKFTQKEIDGIKEKYNTDLSDFEMVEVKE